MLKIEIIGIDDQTGNLLIEVDDKPNNGNSQVVKGDIVQWKVRPGCGVNSIVNITRKSIIGSTDIFSSNPPRSQNAQNTFWKATANVHSSDYDVYIYEIDWLKDGSSEVKKFDPIISIKPTTLGLFYFLLLPVTAFCAFSAMHLMLRKKKKKRWPF